MSVMAFLSPLLRNLSLNENCAALADLEKTKKENTPCRFLKTGKRGLFPISSQSLKRGVTPPICLGFPEREENS